MNVAILTAALDDYMPKGSWVTVMELLYDYAFSGVGD